MNIEPILHASFAIQIHLVLAIFSLVLGTIMWLRPKGTKSHKLIGRIFVTLMFFVAISSIFIRQINSGQFSFIHIFVIVTFVGIFQCFWHIRKRNIKRHVRSVKGLFFGALLIPGVLSMMPGRILYTMMFGAS
ncbi:MAG: hypothetical protein COA43_12170 [Robiginitomaculum sp.]|nr:MAG: hypothetical protein COA43_12170 [Robiginitomaculum sp.]